MASLAKAASGAMIAVNSAAALGLASSIGGTAVVLTQVKEANGRIVPRMEAGLLAAKKAVAGLPYLTAYDIETCVEVNRLRVAQNVDEEAVEDVDRLVDEHLTLVGKLSDGITRSVTHTLEQDARWAMAFGLQSRRAPMSNHAAADPATFVQELFAGIERELQTGTGEVQAWIQAQAHGMAVGLLHSMLPPLVHANYAAVKVTESAIVLPAHAGIHAALGVAEVTNGVLAGAVADKVTHGLTELNRRNDYAEGVNSIRW